MAYLHAVFEVLKANRDVILVVIFLVTIFKISMYFRHKIALSEIPFEDELKDKIVSKQQYITLEVDLNKFGESEFDRRKEVLYTHGYRPAKEGYNQFAKKIYHRTSDFLGVTQVNKVTQEFEKMYDLAHNI